MGIFDRFRNVNKRSLEKPSVPVSASLFDWGGASSSGIVVNEKNALSVPAVWSAVNFLSGTLASLPIHVYNNGERGDKELENLLNRHSSNVDTAYDWKKYTFDRVFTNGRAISLIKRNNAGRVLSIVPVEPQDVTIKRTMLEDGPTYTYQIDGTGIFSADDIIETVWLRDYDYISHISPLTAHKDTIALAIAATKYGSKAFQSGGIPPAVLQGPFQSAASAVRASDDVANTMAKLAREGRPIMALPMGHELKAVGFNPEQMQFIELKRFLVEEIARIYALPPTFLQDLSRATFSNVEQQDLHFVKHTIAKWVKQFESELSLKLFGRNSTQYVRFNLDGLLRGDLQSRMQAYATSIQNGIRTPNEVRGLEDLEGKPEGDDLMIQGATVPIRTQSGEPDANTN